MKLKKYFYNLTVVSQIWEVIDGYSSYSDDREDDRSNSFSWINICR